MRNIELGNAAYAKESNDNNNIDTDILQKIYGLDN